MSAPLSRRLPDYAGRNFAPTAPFTKLAEKQGDKSPLASSYITDAVKKIYEEKSNSNKEARRAMILKGQLVALFIEGKQLLQYNPYSNQYSVVKASRNDPQKIRSINQMQYFATNWMAKWSSSNPDIHVGPLSNADQDVARARKANAVVDLLEREMYDVWYNQHEGLMAQVFGWYGMRVRPDKKQGRTVMQPVMGEREVPIGQGFGKCHDCGWTGRGELSQVEGMPVCPQCGSPAVFYEPPITQVLEEVVGQQPFRIPKIISEQLPFPACWWDIRYRMEDSDWFLYEQEVSESAVRRTLGNIRLPAGGTDNTLGLDVIRELAAMAGGLNGRSDGQSDNRGQNAVVSELYLGLDDLYNIQIDRDEETFAGVSLPKNTRLSEFAEHLGAERLCFVGVNGFNLLSGIFVENHSETCTSGVYHMKPMSGTGRGVEDAVELQKRFNKLDSQAVRHMQAQATPATLHMEGAIAPNHRHLLGTPGVDIPVSIQNFPEINDIKKLVAPLQGSPVSGDMLQYTYQHLNNFMQLAYHITNFSGGLNPRVKNDTATGAEILDANAEEVFQPILQTKSDTRLKNAKKAFNLWCAVNKVKAFVPLKQKAQSGLRGIEVSGEDIQGEYDWRTVPGSELPKNRLSKRRDMVTFYGQFGGAPTYFELKKSGMFDQEIAEIERTFDMDFASNDYDDLSELCRRRFEMAKELFKQAQGLREATSQQFGVEIPEINPLLVLPEVEPSMLVTEGKHEKKMEWYSNLLDTPEGQEMTPDERNLVSAFVTGHGELAKGQAIEIVVAQAQVEQAAMQPGREAAMADQAQQMQMQGEQDAVAAERDAQIQGQQAQADQAGQPDPNEEALRQLATGEIEHEREMELETMRHENALDLEKNRARSTA